MVEDEATEDGGGGRREVLPAVEGAGGWAVDGTPASVASGHNAIRAQPIRYDVLLRTHRNASSMRAQ